MFICISSNKLNVPLGQSDHSMRKKDKFDVPIHDDAGLQKSLAYMRWSDHAVLRRYWSNFAQVAPGVYRSNHPSPKHLEWLYDQGIKTILSFRATRFAPTHTERYLCKKLGLELVICPLSGSRAPFVHELNALFGFFDTLDKPFLMHCKSGADRTSLASALYLIDQAGYSADQTGHMFSLRYIHLKFTKKGILDAFVHAYARASQDTEITLREWVNTAYNPDELQAAFNAR